MNERVDGRVTSRPILVAGIGNVLRGDDGFGVEVVNRLLVRGRLEGVAEVADYGIRGLDLVYALLEQRDLLILVDLARRGGKPGTLYTIDIRTQSDAPAVFETHNMDPVKVVNMGRALGAPAVKTLLVACEPLVMRDDESDDVLMELSAPVASAVDEAAQLIETLILEDASVAQPIGDNPDRSNSASPVRPEGPSIAL